MWSERGIFLSLLTSSCKNKKPNFKSKAKVDRKTGKGKMFTKNYEGNIFEFQTFFHFFPG